MISDLTGKRVKPAGEDAVITGEAEIRGDVIANGLTILPWRQKVLDYGTPTFPTQIWVVARADSSMTPIIPSGDITRDIQAVKEQMRGKSVMGMANTCLEPSLYGVAEAGARVHMFTGGLNDMAPASPRLLIDRNRLMQVIVNLIKNAYEAIDLMDPPPEPKQITVRI